jgi:lysophospholipase L1-like esterase
MGEWLKRALLGLGALLLALAAAEGLLRWLAPLPYSMAVDYEPDAHIGQRLAPDRSYRLADGGTVTVGRLGFRGDGPQRWEKPPGTLRLAALGGSSTFSFNSDDAQIWTALLAERLASHYGVPVEVVNAGVPGLSAFDSRFHFLYRVRELEPDVVLVYHGWNDMKFFKSLEEGKRAVRRNPYRPDRLRQALRTLQLAWRVRALVSEADPGAPPPRPEGALEGRWFADERIPDGGAAHRWERRNYDDLARLIADAGALPVFVAQASLVSAEALADPARRARIYVEYPQLPYDEVLRQTLAIHRIVEAAAEAGDALFIDAYTPVPHTLDAFLDHVHLTPAGNRAVADVLFAALVADPRFAARVPR